MNLYSDMPAGERVGAISCRIAKTTLPFYRLRWFCVYHSIVSTGLVLTRRTRFENLVACHLLKAVDMWNDLGLGDYALYYLRNKAKAEVDFLVAKNGAPWFLVEAKTSETNITPVLATMQKATGAAHAFQVVRDLPYSGVDAFTYREPVAVSAQSFLSQLF